MNNELLESVLPESKEISDVKQAFFESLLKEDVCAGDFSGFVPENVTDLKKKEEDGDSAVC
jgi:hypothetical protein